MFFLIAGVLAIIAGFVVYKIMKSNVGRWIVLAPVVGVVAGIGLIGYSCVAVIPTGHTGVVTTFGRVENHTLEAGINVKAPWQEVVIMDNRVQIATLDLECFSSDIQEVNLRYTLNYQINKANAQEIYRTVGSDYYNVVIVPNIAEAVKVVTARYTAENLVGKRDDLALAIEAQLKTSLSSYDIELVGTAIENMDFTDAFTNAVEAKQVAAQNKLQAQIEQEQKTMEQEQQAKRSVIDANAAADVAKIQAEAEFEVAKIEADAKAYAGEKEAEKNKAIAGSLSPDLVNYYYVLQWDGKLPESYVGSDNPSTIVAIRGTGGSTESNTATAPAE